jgi:hypothetical protein
MNTNLILRTLYSPFSPPFGDFTKGSVLSHADVDNNFIYLKGNIIYTAQTSGNTLTLQKINGDSIQVVISSTGSTSGDIYTTAATLVNNVIYFDRNDQLSAYTVNLSAFSANVSYTNTAATPTTIGGIPAGSTFTTQTIQQMFDALLYPYQSPAFTSFSFGASSPREIGNSITTVQTFTWSTSNSTNVSANTISISGYNLITLNGLANTGSQGVTFTGVVNRTATDTPGTRVWNIQGTNTHSIIFSTSLSIRWDWKMYAGTNVGTTLTAGQIQALSDFNSVKNGFAGTYAMSAGGYKYFSFATGYGTPNTFVDTSTNLGVAMNNIVDGYYTNTDGNGNVYALVSVTNGFGEITNYKVYRTKFVLGATINIAVN